MVFVGRQKMIIIILIRSPGFESPDRVVEVDGVPPFRVGNLFDERGRCRGGTITGISGCSCR